MNLALRSTILLALVVVAIGTPLPSPIHAERADTTEPAERAPPSAGPPAPFELHEWGVWRLDRDQGVVSLADLARESPSFVHRADDAAGARRPEPSDITTVCEKPVIFIHADAPLALRVTVGFAHGRPWLHYPDASTTTVGGVRSLQWSGRALVGDALPEGRAYPAADPAHWWNHLRNARASAFVSSTSGETERFLFYDGETDLAPGFRTRLRRLRAIEGRVEPIAWVVDRGGLAHLDVTGAVATRTPLGSTTALREDMRRTLVAAGLTEAETASLLDTWQSNLFGGATPRVIWMVPRATYDAMLPLDVVPTPRRIVRVGLVIQLL